ncbi:MAG: ATP-binding protein [Lachnospiraceae bacterium]|nr:ATP-binding protein [Lachnospiraceae bacterium]
MAALNDVQNAQIYASGEPEPPTPMEEPEAVLCEFCGKPRRYKKFMVGDLPIYAPPEPCDCPEGKAASERECEKAAARRAAEEQAKREERHRELVTYIQRESGMSARFLQRTFETFIVDDKNRAAYNAAKSFADNFENGLPKAGEPPKGKNGLFIVGPPGTGKTHLAAAAANSVMQSGKAVVFGTMIDLLGNIKEMFKYPCGETALLQKYKSVPLLVIDDMGKEPPTEWAVSTIYNIINGRYEAFLPTIVTTNYASAEFIARLTPKETKDDTTAQATIDRLREMCRGLALSGESRRG